MIKHFKGVHADKIAIHIERLANQHPLSQKGE